MITDKQAKALRVLRDCPLATASQFGQRYFDGKEHEYLHTAVSNQGNGACAGKKAWLCAGSLLGRLAKAGLVTKIPYSEPTRFRLSCKGKEELEAYEK